MSGPYIKRLLLKEERLVIKGKWHMALGLTLTTTWQGNKTNDDCGTFKAWWLYMEIHAISWGVKYDGSGTITTWRHGECED